MSGSTRWTRGGLGSPVVPLACMLAFAMDTTSCARPAAPGGGAPAHTLPAPAVPTLAVSPLEHAPQVEASPSDPCTIARADHARVSPDVVSAAPALPYGECWSASRGTWSLSLDPSGTAWAAVHVDAHGTTTRLARRFDAGDGSDPDGPSIPPFGYVQSGWVDTYDFDGDGDLELFVGILGVWSTHTGLELAESMLYTFKNGAIVRYAPAASIAIWTLEDVVACARVWGMSREAIVKALRLDPKAPDTWPDVLDVTPPTLLR